MARRPALLVALLAAVVASGAPAAAATQDRAASDLAPLVEATGEALPGSYIVVLEPQTDTRAAVGKARRLGAAVTHEYGSALRGYAARLPAAAVDQLRRSPEVAFVEEDQAVTARGTQTGATWGLDRVDQRAVPLDRSYTYATEAAGVHAYVVDTGILLGHAEFAGRLGAGYDAVTTGGSATDCNGHGTHVAGTVGGTTYGVAKEVVLHPVRVLGCTGSGSNAGVIAGVDWVRANHVKPAVANMSLGGGASAALDSAVTSAVSAGVSFAVAAGNDDVDACGSSPARAPSAITVGATTSTDARSSFSNSGTCLDVFAPGSAITSAWHTGPTATNTISGTSMASPHVAGIAALALAATPTATPQQVRDRIVASGTTGVVTGAGAGSPNVLAHSRLTGAATPLRPPAPTLVNGGFESGPGSGWTQTSSGGSTLIGTSKPRTGAYGAWSGGFDRATETLRQTVTVPANGTLSYWWQVTSSETGTTVYDRMQVRVLNPAGAVLATPRSLSNASTRGVWTRDALSLAAYAGQSVQVQFRTTTDASRPTSFYVDDVALS